MHYSTPSLCSCNDLFDPSGSALTRMAPATPVTARMVLGGIPLNRIAQLPDFEERMKGIISTSTLPVVSCFCQAVQLGLVMQVVGMGSLNATGMFSLSLSLQQ